MRPKAKYHTIYAHRDQYPVQVMCQFFAVSRSGYYAFVKRPGKPEADADLAKAIQNVKIAVIRHMVTAAYGAGWSYTASSLLLAITLAAGRCLRPYRLLRSPARYRTHTICKGSRSTKSPAPAMLAAAVSAAIGLPLPFRAGALLPEAYAFNRTEAEKTIAVNR